MVAVVAGYLVQSFFDNKVVKAKSLDTFKTILRTSKLRSLHVGTVFISLNTLCIPVKIENYPIGKYFLRAKQNSGRPNPHRIPFMFGIISLYLN